MQRLLGDYGRLWTTYLQPQTPRVAALAALLLIGTGLQLLLPQIVRFFVDAALGGGQAEWLFAAAGLYIGVALVGQVTALGATYYSEQVAWTATNDLRADLAAHSLRLDLAFHKLRTPGEWIERIDGDVSALASFFSQFAIQVVGNLLLLIGVLALLAREDWRLGLVFALYLGVAVIALLPLRGWAIPAWTANRQASARFFGLLGEQLASTEDIRANGATAYMLARFDEALRHQLPIVRRAELAHGVIWLAGTGAYLVGLLLAIGMSILFWQAGSITIGTIMLIMSYTDLMRRPIDQLRSQLQEIQKAGASIGRVSELLGQQPTIREPAAQPPTGAPVLAPGALALELCELSFAYETAEPVLHDLNLQLAPGRVLGLLGRTGSGKTTLTRLLLRFYDPDSGEIRLGGVPLPALSPTEVRRRVGLVTQEVQLFEASVRDNLTFFDSSIADERIVAALTELGLADWLARLPRGLDTELIGGGGLSAGEAQLLALGRVLLGDPGLVILDEASSRLDPATEQLIERAIERLLRHRTAIIIAHRLATVLRADEILVLDDGRILEHGERVRLAADPASRFAQLLRTGGLQEVLV